MANTVTPLSDGGRLESWTDSSQIHLQKYDASGAKVGAQIDAQAQNFTPEVVALSNGGFAVSTGYVFKGGVYNIAVYDASASLVTTVDAPGGGIGFHLAASPEGGFLLVSEDLHYVSGGPGGYDYSWRPFLTLYDNAGQVTHAPVPLAGTLPTIAVQSDGHYQVQWQDGDIRHTLDIDPAHPPALVKPAAPTLTLIDDQGAHTGVISGSTTDPTPVARIAVSQQGWVEVQQVFDSGNAAEQQITGGVQVTATDVARGYIDVPMDGQPSDGPYAFFARFKTLDGVVSEASTQHVNIYKVAEVWSVTDDAGAQQGVLADGATTDDTTPTVRVGLESSGLHTGDALVLRDQGNEVARVTLTADDTARGYVDVTTGVLAAGDHVLGVTSTPATPGFHLTVAPASDPAPASGGGASGQDIVSPAPGSTLTGTAGDDTIHASQGPDVITGGAGADVIAFHDLPWNSGHVTDFAVGTDSLDLSALFQAAGYTGSDPVADGRMRFDDDGAGGTKVYFDHDQLNGGDWPFLITTLDHVSASGLTWAELSGGPSGGGSTGTGTGDPPPSGGTEGQVITSHQYGDTLTGGAGNDTLNAGQGPDVLTGGGGDDHFAFRDLPWRAGTITDFTPGHDVLDLRALFAASGYAGTDPIGDHRLEFRDDGQGGTAVYFDRDDPNGGDWPFFITTLQGVTPGQIGPGDWLFH
jgi:hypothetical protein